MNTEIQKKLETLAYNRSKPFCYGCYEEAPSGRCLSCGSDDLMCSVNTHTEIFNINLG